MKCVHCGKSPSTQNIVLIRQNPKGEAGIWACELCNKMPRDEELSQITAIIQRALNTETLQ